MFFEEFTSFLQDLMSTSGDVIVVGDINIHLDKPHKTNPNRFRTLLDHVEQHVTSPTHHSGFILDVIITRDNHNIIWNSKVGDLLTDVNLIICKVLLPKPTSPRVTFNTRNVSNVDIISVKSDILAVPVAINDDQSSSFILQTATIRRYQQVHQPVKKNPVTKSPTQPWLSDALYKVHCDKRIANWTWRRTGITV